MTTHAIGKVAVALGMLALVGGCAPMPAQYGCASNQYYSGAYGDVFPPTPWLDCQFGDAVKMAVARQAIDKDAAAKNAGKTAAGMDGAAAKEAVDRYQKSFRTPEKTDSAFTIGVTGSQSGGGGR